MRVYTLSNLVLVHFAENFSLCSKCFQSSYCTKAGFPSLPSPFPFIPFVCSHPNSLDALARNDWYAGYENVCRMHSVCLLLNKTVLSPPWRPTSSPGLFPGRDLFPPLPIFKGKALGTRLRGCPGGWGREEGKQKARGARWERDWKGRRRAYSLFPSCPAGFLFFDVLLFLLGYSVEVSAEERENGLYHYANIYVFFYFRRLLITTGYEIKVHKRWPDFRVIFHERFTAAIRWKTP